MSSNLLWSILVIYWIGSLFFMAAIYSAWADGELKTRPTLVVSTLIAALWIVFFVVQIILTISRSLRDA